MHDVRSETDKVCGSLHAAQGGDDLGAAQPSAANLLLRNLSIPDKRGRGAIEDPGDPGAERAVSIVKLERGRDVVVVARYRRPPRPSVSRCLSSRRVRTWLPLSDISR